MSKTYMPDTDKSVSAIATNGHVLDKSKTNPLEFSSEFVLDLSKTCPLLASADTDVLRLYIAAGRDLCQRQPDFTC